MAGSGIINKKRITRERKECILRKKGQYCVKKGKNNEGCATCFNPPLKEDGGY